METLKNLTKAVSKLALSIFIALLGLAIALFIGVKGYDFYRGQRDKELSVIKEWTENLKENLKISIVTKTKFEDGAMFYHISIEGYPQFFSLPSNRGKGFTMEIIDKDRFLLQKHEKTLQEFLTVVDKENKPIGLSAQGKIFMDSDEYRKIAGIDYSWTFDTKPFSPVPLPKPQAGKPPVSPLSAGADHCAPGLSKVERLFRLSQKGTVREVGYQTFSTGGHRIAFSGESVLSCW